MATKIITATIDALRTLQDRSVKASLITQELSANDIGELFSFQGKYCKILITDLNVISPDMIKATEETEIENWEKKKSQGARLRGVLYLLYTKSNEGHNSFESFYLSKTNSIIEHYKSKLE